MITAHQFIDQARSYLGVQFRHQGRSRESGLDCIGLLSRTAQDLGIPIDDDLAYSYSPDPVQMLRGIQAHCVEIPLKQIQPGCIVWMKFVNEPQHVALITDAGILHSYNVVGEVIEHSLNKVWRRRIFKAFKIDKVDYE